MSKTAHRLWRIAGQARWDDRDTRRALPQQALDRLASRVAASETSHRGEIRVCVEARLPLSYLWKNLSARDRALTMFGKLRVWDTEANNGVLIYLLLAEHAIEIVADRALARQVPASRWSGIVQAMQQPLREGRYEAALVGSIEAIDALLRASFPRFSGDADENELPNAVALP